MLYYKNRSEAGKMLAKKLRKYKGQNCAVVALSRGAVLVGEQIAKEIHASLMILLTEKIRLPGELEDLAGMTADNTFTYNNMFSAGELEEMMSEYFTYIEQRRRENLHRLHSLFGGKGEIRTELLHDHIIILVSDGMASGFSLDIAADYLKRIRYKKLVVAVPVASVPAIDRMHLLSDEFFCLSIAENFISTNHYYDENKIPSPDQIIEIIQNIPMHWSQGSKDDTNEPGGNDSTPYAGELKVRH